MTLADASRASRDENYNIREENPVGRTPCAAIRHMVIVTDLSHFRD